MLIDTIKYKGHNIEIHTDDDPMNPRTEWDNLGKMVCFHNRYNLGDEHGHDDVDDFMLHLVEEVSDEYPEIFDKLEENYDDGYERGRNLTQTIVENHYYILPLYLYDHSGITISTGEFSCPWDSGQVGWIYVSKKEAEKQGWDDPAKRAIKYLGSEVTVYDQYLTGEVYGYMTEATTDNGADYQGSCWGFFGDDGKELMIQEAKAEIDYAVKEYRKKYNPFGNLYFNIFQNVFECC